MINNKETQAENEKLITQIEHKQTQAKRWTQIY